MRNRAADWVGGFLVGVLAIIVILAISPIREPYHAKHVRDIPKRTDESVMVAMVTQAYDDRLEVIGCPVDPAYGPVMYDIRDAAFATAGLQVGEYVPIVYAWDPSTNDYGGTYTFLGWASKEPVP